MRARSRGVALWLEPGRFLVAKAGVLLAQVTQTKGKGGDAIRGRGHRHEFADSSRAVWRASRHRESHALRRAGHMSYNVVGPICESSDFLGHERLLPPNAVG